MNTRFWELQIKGKIVKQAVRACLWAPGGGSGPARVRTPVRFKPPGAKAGHL